MVLVICNVRRALQHVVSAITAQEALIKPATRCYVTKAISVRVAELRFCAKLASSKTKKDNQFASCAEAQIQLKAIIAMERLLTVTESSAQLAGTAPKGRSTQTSTPAPSVRTTQTRVRKLTQSASLAPSDTTVSSRGRPRLLHLFWLVTTEVAELARLRPTLTSAHRLLIVVRAQVLLLAAPMDNGRQVFCRPLSMIACLAQEESGASSRICGTKTLPFKLGLSIAIRSSLSPNC